MMRIIVLGAGQVGRSLDCGVEAWRGVSERRRQLVALSLALIAGVQQEGGGTARIVV